MKPVELMVKRAIFDRLYPYSVCIKKYFLGFIPYWSRISYFFNNIESAIEWMNLYPESYIEQNKEKNRLIRVISENQFKNAKSSPSLTKD